MTKFIYIILLTIGVFFWIVSIFFMYIVMLMSALGKKLHISETHNNCWVYALSRYFYSDGYLIIRQAGDVKFLNLFSIPHIMWANTLPGRIKVEQFVPIKRKSNKILPWHVFYFSGIVKKYEDPIVGKDDIKKWL